MKTHPSDTRSYCAYCGHPLAEAGAPERFGERFCSEAHAEEFAAGVRAARMRAVAHEATEPGSACALPRAGQRSWSDHVKRGLCWGAPLLMLLAIPLIWSGGWAAAGGSLLSVAALLACPLGMYFMMRGMMGMQHQDSRTTATRGKEDHRA